MKNMKVMKSYKLIKVNLFASIILQKHPEQY